MNTTSRIRLLALVAVLALSLGLQSTRAQDDEEEKSGGFHASLELASWQAQPVGLQYEPASVGVLTDALGTSIIGMDHGTNPDALYRASFDFGPAVGEFRLSWYAQTDESTVKNSQPGSFVFGELLAYPVGAGWQNDGYADGFKAAAETGYSEFRFDYARQAFQNDTASGKWFIGVRRITHDRNLDATYYALSPDMPVLIPPLVDQPRPDLDPFPDSATIGSSYAGRGLEGGMDFLVFVVPRRVTIEAGFAVGALRGKMDTGYSSTNAVYLFTDPTTMTTDVYAPPYEFDAALPGGGVVADATTQAVGTFRMFSSGQSTASPFVDLYLGLRGRVVAGLELLAGVRAVYYGSVGADIRPKASSATNVGTNLVDVNETERSVGYEGLYFGAAYTF